MAEHPERVDIAKIRNTQERRATLIVDMLEDRAQRIVDAMDEPPPGTNEPPTAQIKAMWNFSPFGARAAESFWTLHDLALQNQLQQIAQVPMPGDQQMKAVRNAHQQAEAMALGKVYPQRATLILLGITTPERSVALAERARRLVDGDVRRQGEPAAQTQEAAY